MTTPPTSQAKWFWYSIFSVICFGGWGLFGKLGSMEIPASTMQFIFALGFLPVAPALFAAQRFKPRTNWKGILCALASGILSGIAGVAFYAAFRSGGNTSVITTATALYPMITVILAVLILRERLTRLQVMGLGFAAAGIILLSLG